jgi:hypothetical protein
MKHIFVTLLSIFLYGSVFAQSCKDDILGVWQYESKEIGSAWLDTYQFFSDGTFIFNLSQYDEIKRIIAIKGHYRLTKEAICFKVEYTTELVGGHIVRDNLTSIHGSWALSGNFIKKEIKQPDTKDEYAPISFLKESTGSDCILIDGRKFYRISKDPTAY